MASLEKSDVMLKPIGLQETDHALAMLTRKDRFLIVDLAEFKTLSGGGRGTILMGLDSGDRIEQWCAVSQAGVCLSGVYRNKQTDVVLDAAQIEEYQGKRARKGRALAVKVKQPLLRRM